MFVHNYVFMNLFLWPHSHLSRFLQRLTPCSTPSSLLTLISASIPTWAKIFPWMRIERRSSTCCWLRASATWRGTRRSLKRWLASSPGRKAPSRGWRSGHGSGLTCIMVCPLTPRSCRFNTGHLYLACKLFPYSILPRMCLYHHDSCARVVDLLTYGFKEYCVNAQTHAT